MTIWTIMGVEKSELDEHGWPRHGHTWVAGYYLTYESAKIGLANCGRLLNDDGCNYVVLEEYEEGISGNVIDSTEWFQWDAAAKLFVPMDQPQHEQHFCSYAMG